jgi:hypothetical protein
MLDELALAGAHPFDAYPQSKQFQVTKIGFHPMKAFEWRFLCDTVNKAVVQVYQVK